MEIIQIATIALVGTILAVTLKSQRPEFALLISLAAGTIILYILSSYLKSVFDVIGEISSDIDLDVSFIEIIFKIVSIAYICEFSSQVCRDAGEAAIATKVELAGKILILFTSAPIILSLLELLTELI